MSLASDTVLREHEADLRVEAVDGVADGVVALTLVDPSGAPLPAWTPGAHVDLVLSEGITRQYSLCGNPADTGAWRVGVLLTPDSRGGSERVHRLCPGDALRVRGPRNHFPLVGSPRYLFVAGGIGITPILPMIAQVAAAGAQWNLVYGGRSRATMAFLDRLEAHGERVRIAPQDETGHLDLPALLGEPRPDTLVYCCGPEGLLSAVEAQCAAWPDGALHLERFAPKRQETTAEADGAFELVLQASGMSLHVPPDRSVFDVVSDAGVSVLGSCFEGVCGTCEQSVVAGDVEHRDSILTDEERAENQYMMICVSRCRSAQLVLDL